MAWPLELAPDRYPGTIRREISVESRAVDGHLVFTAVLRDRWRADGGHFFLSEDTARGVALIESHLG